MARAQQILRQDRESDGILGRQSKRPIAARAVGHSEITRLRERAAWRPAGIATRRDMNCANAVDVTVSRDKRVENKRSDTAAAVPKLER